MKQNLLLSLLIHIVAVTILYSIAKPKAQLSKHYVSLTILDNKTPEAALTSYKTKPIERNKKPIALSQLLPKLNEFTQNNRTQLQSNKTLLPTKNTEFVNSRQNSLNLSGQTLQGNLKNYSLMQQLQNQVDSHIVYVRYSSK